MKILRFDIVNDKAIKSWIHEANGGNVQIAGEPGTGKTTAASALWDIAYKTKDTLTHGQDEGHISVCLGDDQLRLIATRKFTETSSTLQLVHADGSKCSAADFKAMISSLSVNPHKIADMKPLERISTLLASANLGENSLQMLDKSIAQAEESRIIAHRMAEQLKPGPKPEPIETIDVSDLATKIKIATNDNERYRTAKRDLGDLGEKGVSLKENVQELQRILTSLEERITKTKSAIKKAEEEKSTLAKEYVKLRAKIETMPTTDHKEIESMEDQIKKAQETNQSAAEATLWEAKNKDYTNAVAKHTQAQKTINELRRERAMLLDNAEWPLEGLSIADGDVQYHGVCVSNLGMSEQMLVYAALAIKDILAHPLHVVRIDGIESMSKEDFAKLNKLFGDADIQVISTRVARDGIENGELVITEVTNKN